MLDSTLLRQSAKLAVKNLVGSRFRRELAANLRLSREGFERLQEAGFRRMYAYATSRVPYYRDRPDAYPPGLATRLPHREALLRLPVLTKEALRRHNDELFADPPHRFTTTHTTSGTTGMPVRIRGDLFERALHDQLALRQAFALAGTWKPATVRLTSAIPRGYRGGRVVHWRDPLSRVLYLSMYEPSPARAEEYRERIERASPEIVFGYGSVLYAVADCIGEPLRLPRIRGVISTAETMREDWLPTIERVFGCRLHEQYGTQESQFLVTGCAAGSLHVNPEPGIVEIVSDAGSPAAEGEPGNVLVTGTARLSMPLIRFDITDVAISTGFRSGCACGCEWPTIGPVVGRVDDLVVTPSGQRLTAMNWHTTKDVAGIAKSQLVQHELRRFEMKIVAAAGYDREASERTMRSVIHEFVGPDVEVAFNYLDEIPTGTSWKFRAVVSHVRMNRAAR